MLGWILYQGSFTGFSSPWGCLRIKLCVLLCGCLCLYFIDHYVYGYDVVMINVLRSCITFEILTNIMKIEMNFNDLQNKMGHWKKLKHHWRKEFVFVVIIIFSLRLFVYSHIRPQFQSICNNIIFLKLSCHQTYGNLEKLVFHIF